LDMGRRLERAAASILLLRGTLVERASHEVPLLEAILDIADSGMTYRRRYLASPEVAPVVDLLLVDETNPRSVVDQLRAIVDHLVALPLSGRGWPGIPARLAMAALTEAERADVRMLASVGPDGMRDALQNLLVSLGRQVAALSDAVSSHYLTHASMA